MKTSTAVLGGLLAVSLLFNLADLTRLKAPERIPPTPAPAPARPSAPRPAPPAVAAVPSLDPAPAPVTAVVAPAAPSPAPAPTAYGAITSDPEVMAVLEAQEEHGRLWKDLDRVFKARDRLDEAKFLGTVMEATTEFLRLPAPQRPLFAQTARAAAEEMARARADHEAAKQGLPPKDKSNAAAYEAYRLQKDVLDRRLGERSRAAA
ncbi:MAG TPA: hypothetical protein VEJ18_10985, partial [Planctomycetota bacterium]|nr:hypothetical protein [Planctomycetota bacterium]